MPSVVRRYTDRPYHDGPYRDVVDDRSLEAFAHDYHLTKNGDGKEEITLQKQPAAVLKVLCCLASKLYDKGLLSRQELLEAVGVEPWDIPELTVVNDKPPV